MKVNLPKWMCEHNVAISRAEARRYIHSGQVWLNGEQIRVEEVEVKAGDELHFPPGRLKIVVEA